MCTHNTSIMCTHNTSIMCAHHTNIMCGLIIYTTVRSIHGTYSRVDISWVSISSLVELLLFHKELMNINNNKYVYSPISNAVSGPPRNISNICLDPLCAGEWR